VWRWLIAPALNFSSPQRAAELANDMDALPDLPFAVRLLEQLAATRAPVRGDR
jgi:hypothetical protein